LGGGERKKGGSHSSNFREEKKKRRKGVDIVLALTLGKIKRGEKESQFLRKEGEKETSAVSATTWEVGEGEGGSPQEEGKRAPSGL